MRGLSPYPRRVRLIAATVLMCFVWTAVEGQRLVLLAQTATASAGAADPAFQSMDDAVSAVEMLLDDIDGQLAAGSDASASVAALDTPGAAVDAADVGVRRALEAIEGRLVSGGVPPQALQRHAEF